VTRGVFLLVFLPMLLAAQRVHDNVIPVKNWPTPLHWRPNHAERDAAAKPVPRLKFSMNQVSADALTFVAITPCRLVDTRGAGGGFNGIAPFDGPSIPGGGTATFPVQSASEASDNTMPAPCGTIPSIAEAYSFNLTVIPHAGGPVGYVTLWPAGAAQPFVATLTDGQGLIVNNAAIVPAGAPSGGVSVYNDGPAAIDVIIDMNGFFAAPTDLNGNTAIGGGTLASNTTGSGNTASGGGALQANTTGGDNTASGSGALGLDTTGIGDTAIGAAALNGGNGGDDNIAVGFSAGISSPDGNSNSIYVGSEGSGGDNGGTIQIGTQGIQTGGTYIAGIYGAAVVNGTAVYIDSNGQLGTVPSSRRFKERITDMGDSSSKLFQLRPVNFFYKPEYDDGSHLLQYGLIAEEVAKVYPEMVAYGNDGRIMTVKYQLLAPMLLNEVQKQHAEVEKLDVKLDRQDLEAKKRNQRAQQRGEAIRQLQAQLASLEAQLSKVPATATAGQ